MLEWKYTSIHSIFQQDGGEQSNYIQGESTMVHNGYKSGKAQQSGPTLAGEVK